MTAMESVNSPRFYRITLPSDYIQSCSTFMLSRNGTFFVGHNLDENFEVPGLVVVNKRGLEKGGVSWQDLHPFKRRSTPRIKWVSKYGSISYNTFGKEFIDGGMNEAGLYIGEMTLLGTQYPQTKGLPKLYHHMWMQYILDNFRSVEEVLNSLDSVLIDGHCQWHFFVADRKGNAATIEFINGRKIVHAKDKMPIKVLCNSLYANEIKELSQYQGFGGQKEVDLKDKREDKRFIWGAEMIRQYETIPSKSEVEYCFDMLRQLDCGSSKWSIVYDTWNLCMYFNTSQSRKTKFLSYSSFDFSCNSPVKILDINQDLSGNVTQHFQAFDDSTNREYLKKTWKAIGVGFPNSLIFSLVARRMNRYANSSVCSLACA